MTDRDLLQETHDAVTDIRGRMAVWCPEIDRRVDGLDHVVNGTKDTDGLKATVSWHGKLFAWVAVPIIGLFSKAMFDFWRE